MFLKPPSLLKWHRLLLYLETFNFVYYILLHFSNSQVQIAVNSHYTPFKRFTPLDIISLQISPQALLSFMSIKCYQNRLGSFNNRHLACLQNKDVCSIGTYRCQHKRRSFRNSSGARLPLIAEICITVKWR